MSVFISVADQEVLAGELLKELLQNVLGHDLDVFLAVNDIEAGEPWYNDVIGELSRAKIIISILSPASVDRPWMNFEAGALLGSGRQLIALGLGIQRSEIDKIAGHCVSARLRSSQAPPD